MLLLLQVAADDSRRQLAGVLGTLVGLSVVVCGAEGAAASDVVTELSNGQVRRPSVGEMCVLRFPAAYGHGHASMPFECVRLPVGTDDEQVYCVHVDGLHANHSQQQSTCQTNFPDSCALCICNCIFV
jgi:hypothetical protein